MSIFQRQKIHFQSHDPLDNGLRDEIVAEQREADAFMTLDDISGDDLSEQWASIIKDARKDPDWFSFSNE